MMELDDLGREAGAALVESARRVERPALVEVRSARRRRPVVATVLAGFLATALVVGVLQVWPGLDERTAPIATTSPSLSTTTTVAGKVTVGEMTYDLLDGSALRVASTQDLALSSYSFFVDVVGERQVEVVRADDPAQVAATETASRDEVLAEDVMLWTAEREGRPVFMSVDLGLWVVWLNVGNEGVVVPSSETLLSVAAQLTGVAGANGVILPDLQLSKFEIHFMAGDDRSVTVRVGACFEERVFGSELIDHPTRGPIIRADRYASWCDGRQALEVSIDGPATFVDELLDSLRVERFPSDTAAETPQQSTTFLDLTDLLTVDYPSTWYLSERVLTPDLADPVEVLALATYPLRSGGPNCAQFPVNALHDLTSTDAIIILQERLGASAGFSPRPDSFGLELSVSDPGSVAIDCMDEAERADVGTIRWIWFRENDRNFHLLVVIGHQASQQTVEQATEILDGLVIIPTLGDVPGEPPASCPLTSPTPGDFTPPLPYPEEPPALYNAAWYGTDQLWTMIGLQGEAWHGLPHDDGTYTQKLLWWREGLDPLAEPSPALRVTASRLDAPILTIEGAFPATHGIRGDIGNFMLTGIDLPSPGCWRITGSYQTAQLSYIVWVDDD